MYTRLHVDETDFAAAQRDKFVEVSSFGSP